MAAGTRWPAAAFLPPAGPQQPGPVGPHVYTPIAFDHGQVLVAAGAHAGSGALEIVRVDPATGKAVSATATTRAPFFNPYLALFSQFGWDNGQVFGVSTSLPLIGPHTRLAAFALG